MEAGGGEEYGAGGSRPRSRRWSGGGSPVCSLACGREAAWTGSTWWTPAGAPPVHLYRISQGGVDCFASGGGAPGSREILQPAPERDDPGAVFIYIPRRPWLALDLLRRHASHRLGPVRWREYGWLTPAEMRPRLSCVLGEDMPWLLGRGLVERRVDSGAAAPIRPAWFYRASALAMGLELVDAAAVGSGPAMFVQLRTSTGPAESLPAPTAIED